MSLFLGTEVYEDLYDDGGKSKILEETFLNAEQK